jgi:thiol:disulfide interchange protein DsbD
MKNKKLFYIFSILILYLNLSYGSLIQSQNNNASFLMPDQAFKTSISTTNDDVVFTLNLADSIYIYDDQLIINILNNENKLPIRSRLTIATPQEYHETLVHMGNIIIKVPKLLISQMTNNQASIIEFNFQGCSKAGLCYQPMTKTINVSTDELATATVVSKQSQSESDTIASTLKSGNITLILLTFFGFGLLLALTPCVFPMIPILSSIIVSHSKEGKDMSAKKGLYLSIVYVLAMSVAYTIAGVIAGLFGANLQAALQNPIVLIVFAGVFVALAFSMFGYYEIGLSASWQTKIDQFASKKDKDSGHGIAGVAIMGFLSALIVGPCVAPPLAGALVYIGQTGDALLGGAALFIMSIGMGLPLLLVGAGAGKYMPKPGGWMDNVSKVFGVVMLGVAIWMLERIIPIGFTFMLWSLLFFGWGIYLFRSINKFTKLIAIIFMIIGIVFGIGLATKSTNILDPFENIGSKQTKYLEFKRVKTLDELNSIINTSSKPIMLDFYANWCVSCKELEHTTFTDPQVQKILKDFLLLQVDTTDNNANDKALLKRFNLFGPPGIVFFKDKEELKNITIIGYKDPKEFLEIIGEEF